MKTALIVVSTAALAAILVVSLLDPTTPVAERQGQDACRQALPSSLTEILKKKYPGWNLVTLEDLGSEGAEFYRKDAVLNPGKNPTGCPGVAQVDLYGDARQVYAVVLLQKFNSQIKSKLILAEVNSLKEWAIRTLMDDKCACAVRAIPPGEHKDVTKGHIIKSRGEALLYIKYEAYAIVFAWTGKRVEQVYVQD